MLTHLKFPLLYVLEAILLAPFMTAFVGIISFVAAKPLSSFNLGGKSLPSDWHAAVPNHGRFLRGFLISEHPTAFGVLVLLSLGTGATLYLVQRAELAQFRASGSSSAHRVARAAVFSVWITLGYILTTRVLVGINPS